MAGEPGVAGTAIPAVGGDMLGMGGLPIPPGMGGVPNIAGMPGSGGFPGAGGVLPEVGGMDGVGGEAAGAAGTPSNNRLQAGMVCDRLATVQCEGEARCCANPGRTFDACKAEFYQICTSDGSLDQITLNPIVNYSVDQMEAVLNELERRNGACDPNTPAWVASAAGLRSIFLGTVAVGGNCHPGTTMDLAVQAAHLASCTGPQQNGCLPQSALSFKCSARVGQGGPCFTDINCLDGLYCDNPNLERITGSTCLPTKPPGQPCLAPSECQSALCRGGVCAAAEPQAAFCFAGG